MSDGDARNPPTGPPKPRQTSAGDLDDLRGINRAETLEEDALEDGEGTAEPARPAVTAAPPPIPAAPDAHHAAPGAHDAPARARVHIANRTDGGILLWVGKLYGFAALVLVVVAALTAFFTYRYFALAAPPAPDLAQYAVEAPAVSRLYAADGTLLGEFATEWREIVAFEDIPPELVNAFLAIEDHEFFSHTGIYFKGIARAAWTNVVAGDFEQGGSTITQQVAKQFLGNEKSLSRKAKEAIVARRLEARYSKKAILALYLNHIYLGGGAYGVAAAAQRYFSKRLDELTLAEMATIAGLASAPSANSPLSNPDGARARRDLVLDKMAAYGLADQAVVDRAKAEPIEVDPYDDVFPERMPYFAEHLRRYVVETYGPDALLEDGLTVEATAEPAMEAPAYEVVEFGARKQDKRQGWRGPEWYLDEGRPRDTFLERSRKLYGDGPLDPERRYLALVEEVDARRAVVIVGATRYALPLDNMRWASEWTARTGINDEEISSARSALKPGDVVWVSADEHGAMGKFRDWILDKGVNPRWKPPREARPPRRDDDDLETVELEQVPHPQVALFSADHQTGYVKAMVGGHDYARSEYNRAVQACRQPGSTYKPIYYALALDQGFGYDTRLSSEQVQVVTDDAEWSVEDFGGETTTEITLEYALVFSKNISSIRLFRQAGGIETLEPWARKLGFRGTVVPQKCKDGDVCDALALGAVCTTMDQMTRAFAIFARNGKGIDWRYVRRITDRHGNVIEDNTVPGDPYLAAGDRIDRMALVGGIEAEQAIDARTGYLINKLLARTIEFGFSSVVRQTGIPAAGKTGTSSATMDMAFIGYSSNLITTIWMGDDLRVRPLGKSDAAYMTVEPLWARYMWDVSREMDNQEIPWEVPDGVDPRDRGAHSKGERGERSDLRFRPSVKPGEGEGEGQDDAGVLELLD